MKAVCRALRRSSGEEIMIYDWLLFGDFDGRWLRYSGSGYLLHMHGNSSKAYCQQTSNMPACLDHHPSATHILAERAFD